MSHSSLYEITIYEFSRSDLTVDCWAWVLPKPYAAFSITKESPYKKGNTDTSFRIIKRIYKCKNSGALRKTITVHYAAGESATGHSSFKAADQNAFISYKLENEERMIEPSKKSRIYPKVREKLQRKIEQGKPQNKLLMKYLKKRLNN